MLSSRAKIRPNVVLARQLQQQRSAGATLRLSLNAAQRRSYAAAAATPQQQQDEAAASDSIKHLIKGPVTPLTIFATSPPPAPHPSTYIAPAAAAAGASLDFRLSFAFPTVQRIKEERFKEEMGVFKILHERPFLREYKNVMEEKQERKRSERRAARKALKEKKKLGLVADDRKKTLFELEQDRQRRMYLQTLQYPFQLPEVTVKADELKKYFNFIATHSEKEIYDRLYPEFFGDSREHVESLVPHKHDAYVWDTFFDPENPNEHSTQAEAEGDIWESLNKSAEEQLSDLVDEMEGEQEKEARLTAWELDPGRFKGRWTPRDWPKEDLELSHIKHRARNLRYLREQLKKHGLLPEEDESTTREALIKTTTASVEETSTDIDEDLDNDEDVVLRFSDDKDNAKADKPSTPADTEDELTSLLNAVLQPSAGEEFSSEDRSALLDTLMPGPSPTSKSESVKAAAVAATEPVAPAVPEHDPVAWSAKLDKLRADIKKRIAEGASHEAVEEEVINFIETEGELQDPDGSSDAGGEDDDDDNEENDDGDVDWEARLDQIPGPKEESEGLTLYGSEEAMQLAKDREARLHKLEEHVKVNFDDSQKKQIFANEPVPGEPSIEFIHSYSMDPDVTMGSLGRRDFLQRKVVMKVHVPSLSLPSAVQQRLVDLVGTRYDAQSGWLKLVGDKHPNRHLNQKYLKLLMRELLNESFLADSRYTPLASLDVQDPSSLRRKYSVPSTLHEVLDGKKAKASGGWEYRMFKFGRLDGHYPTAQEVNEDAAKLRQRLASAFSS